MRDVDSSAVSKSFLDVIRRSEVTVENFLEVIIGVEKLAIGSAMDRITPDELDALKKCIDDAETMVETAGREGRLPALDSWVKTNTEFHLVLARATRNPLFETILESFMTVVRAFLHNPPLVPEYFKDHPKHHRGIYEAMKDKNLGLAKRRLEAHSVWIGKTLSVGNNPVESGETE